MYPSAAVTVYSPSSAKVCASYSGWGMRFGLFFHLTRVWHLLAWCLLAFLVNLPAAAVSDPSSTAEQYYDQGVQALRQEQWKAALSSFEQSLKLDPKRADAANGMGVALGKLGDPEGSQGAFRRAIEIDP